MKKRWILQQDLPQLVAIEEELYSDAFTVRDFHEALTNRHATGMIVEDPWGEVAGYIIYQVKEHCYEIQRLSVDRRMARQGYGTQLINILKAKLSKTRPSIGLRVHERGLETQLFLRAQGFTCIGTIPGEGNDGEDIYLFEYIRR